MPPGLIHTLLGHRRTIRVEVEDYTRHCLAARNQPQAWIMLNHPTGCRLLSQPAASPILLCASLSYLPTESKNITRLSPIPLGRGNEGGQ